MNENGEHLSRPVRIRLKKSGEVIEGMIVFNTNPQHNQIFSKFFATIRVRFNDEQKTEKLYSLVDVGMIEYL